MNKYDDKDSVAALNRSLGINLEEIINDPQLNDDQKFNAIYGKVLTALLNKWIKNDTSGQLGLPEGFNVDEFVKQQVAGASNTEVDYIPNILVVPDYAKKLKNAREDEVRKEVKNLFNLAHTVIDSHRFDVDLVAQMMFGAGVMAFTLIGAATSAAAFGAAIAAAIATFGGSSPVTLPAAVIAIAGLAATGAGLVATGFAEIASIFSLLATISINRSFYGIVLNDTDHDLLIPEWDCIQGNDKMEGIYSRHGKVSGLMVDGYAGEQKAIVGKRTVVENNKLCCCGLYQMDKTNYSLTGTESLMRFDWDNTKFDLYSSCPMHDNNVLDISFDYVDKKMYEATSQIANEWKKNKSTYYKKDKNGLTVSSSLNSKSGSPAYGIVCVG